MGNTNTQIHLQLIFAVKYRAAKQVDHHRKITFLDEYRSFLKEFEIEFDERYIFKEPE